LEEICCVRIVCEDELSMVSIDGNGSEELIITNGREISDEEEDWGGWWMT
jgi:hypothetical protein